MNNLKEKEDTGIETINIIRNKPYITYSPFDWMRSASRVPFISVGLGETLNVITPINWVKSEIGVDDEITFSENSSQANFFRELDIETIKPEYQGLFIIDKSATTERLVDENSVNEERLKLLEEQFTRELIALIMDEDFEYGIDTKADVLVRSQMQLNALATKSWLNQIFVENFHNIPILLGILRIIARLDYHEVSPEGQTMAVAALSHKNVEAKECGVRAFESWGTTESLNILEKLEVSTQWLQEYIDEVVSDLRKEYNVPIRQENR